MKNTIVCIGELLIDFVAQERGALGTVKGFEKCAGGAPANVAACVAGLGGKASFLTKLGRDEFGEWLKEVLQSRGVDTSSVLFTSQANTPLAFVSLDEDGERHFSFYRNPSSDLFLDENDVTEKNIEGGYLHFGSVDLVDYPVRRAHEKAIALAKQKGMTVSFDVNLRYNLWDGKEALFKTVKRFLPLADVVKVNEEELRALYGENEEDAIETVTKTARLLAVTRGKRGADLYVGGKRYFQPSYPAKCVDTTGAGDVFMGTLLYQLQTKGITAQTLPRIGGETAQALIKYACKASGYSVAKRGAIPSMPRYDDVFKGE